jgi:hypothetical protein
MYLMVNLDGAVSHVIVVVCGVVCVAKSQKIKDRAQIRNSNVMSLIGTPIT